MKNQWTLRVRLAALAVVGLALTAAVGSPAHAAAPRSVMPLNGWNGRLGPGVGSVKTPFLIVEVGTPLGGQSDDTVYFHTSTGQPVQQVPDAPMGPGLWSIKSPFNRLYPSGTF